MQAISQFAHILVIMSAVGRLGVDELAGIAVGWTVCVHQSVKLATAYLSNVELTKPVVAAVVQSGAMFLLWVVRRLRHFGKSSFWKW